MRTTAFAVITLLVLSFTAEAQSIKPKSIYAKQKTFEIGGDIMFNSTEYVHNQSTISSTSSSHTTTNIIINGTFGIFAVDWLKLAVEPAIQLSYSEGSSWSQSKIYFSPEYILNTKSNVYPYLGGSAGYTSRSYSGSSTQTHAGFSWGLKGGIKVNVFGNALINVGVSYFREQYEYNDSYNRDFKENYNVLALKTGLSIFFG